MDRPASAEPRADAHERLACVNVPELPLQLLLRAHPDWVAHPAAVIEADKPHAPLLWVNELSRQHGIAPGQRYSTALSLCRTLRASTITTAQIHEAIDVLCTLLRRFSPHIEPAHDDPGIFWVDASGLRLLFSSLTAWAHQIEQALREAGFTAIVVAGFSRFYTYALARSHTQSVLCLRDRQAEHDAAQHVTLARLKLDLRVRETLSQLGVHTVGAFVKLPSTGLLERFGADVFALHQLAAGHTWSPLHPLPAHVPLLRRVLFDEAERDVYRLLFVIKRELDELLRTLTQRQQALRSLNITCHLDGADPYVQSLSPAEPSLDSRVIVDLVRLRLEATPLPGAATELSVEVLGIDVSAEQLKLLTEALRRDLAAADRALARVRAELGVEAVTYAVLQDAHLPEARVSFRPLQHMRFPTPCEGTARPVAIRRLWTMPRDAYLIERTTHHAGPFVISGGWWSRQVHRQYHFIAREDGELLYVYFDAERGRWLIQGAL